MQTIFDLGRTKKFIWKKLKLIRLAFVFVGFFIARVIVFKFLSPFAIAYLSLFFGGMDFYFLSFIILLGLLNKLSGIYFLRYLFAIFFMGLINIFVNKKKLFFKALNGFLCLFLSSVIIFFIWHRNNFLLLTNFFESMFVFCLAYVLSPIKKFFLEEKKFEFDNDLLIGLGIIFGAIICGMSDICFANIFIMDVIIFLCLMIIGRNFGSSYSCMFGFILGIILNLVGIIEFNKI